MLDTAAVRNPGLGYVGIQYSLIPVALSKKNVRREYLCRSEVGNEMHCCVVPSMCFLQQAEG